MELRKLVCHPKSIFLVGEIFCFSKLSMILDKYGFERLNDFLWHEHEHLLSSQQYFAHEVHLRFIFHTYKFSI